MSNFKDTNTNVVKILDCDDFMWLDIINPNEGNIEVLRQNYNFHELLLEDCLTENQRSKVDDFSDYSFVILHFPVYNKGLKKLDYEEIDIFIGDNFLITLHEGGLKPLIRFVNNCLEDKEYRYEQMKNSSAILLQEIIKMLFNYCFPMLDKIGFKIEEINKNIFTNRDIKMLEEISRLKMQIINYRKVIKPLRPVLKQLDKSLQKYLPNDTEHIQFDDIFDKNEKVWSLLDNYKEIIESIENTFSSLVGFKSNQLMKTFTMLQILTLPMALLGTLFSMNLEGIPIHTLPNAFAIVVSMMVIPTLTLSILFKIKGKEWF